MFWHCVFWIIYFFCYNISKIKKKTYIFVVFYIKFSLTSTLIGIGIEDFIGAWCAICVWSFTGSTLGKITVFAGRAISKLSLFTGETFSLCIASYTRWMTRYLTSCRVPFTGSTFCIITRLTRSRIGICTI